MVDEVNVNTANDIKVSKYTCITTKFTKGAKSAFVTLGWDKKDRPQFRISYYDTEIERTGACQQPSFCGTTSGAESKVRRFLGIK